MKYFFCCIFFLIIGQTQAQTPDLRRVENSTRLMSYNIRNARGMDEKVDYQRIADIITKASPDVIALQELDSVTERSQKTDVLNELSALTKMHAVYGASIEFQGGKYGIGMLSKEKPLSWQRLPLPGREEARSLLVVEFEKYIVCCTHFSLKDEDRLASVNIINEFFKNPGKPVFLAGDINAEPNSSVLKKFMEKWEILNDTTQFTIPSGKPNRTIDYIFLYKGNSNNSPTVSQRRVLNEPVASDHLPVFVDIKY